jgi:hypothetical protein
MPSAEDPLFRLHFLRVTSKRSSCIRFTSHIRHDSQDTILAYLNITGQLCVRFVSRRRQ